MNMRRAAFDRRRINDEVERNSKRRITKSLAFVRRRARSTYRRRKRVSRPDQAPSVHSSHPYATLKNIWFNYDARTKSGVVGPVKIRSSRSLITSSQAVPGLLEAGGTVTIPEQSWDGKEWFQMRSRQRRRGQRLRKRRVRIAKRPAMVTALEKEAEKGNILSPWANVITE